MAYGCVYKNFYSNKFDLIDKDRDCDAANLYLKEAEKLKMDLECFRETKLAKVVKFLSKKDIKEHSISERCLNLTIKWKQELEAGIMEKSLQKPSKIQKTSAAAVPPKTGGGDDNVETLVGDELETPVTDISESDQVVVDRPNEENTLSNAPEAETNENDEDLPSPQEESGSIIVS